MMSAARGRAFNFGVVVSILIGIASIGIGCWGMKRPFLFAWLDGGVGLGNKQLIAYREGADFRVAAVSALEAFDSYLGPSADASGATGVNVNVNAYWGGPDHWLKVPEFSVSLWWLLALSCVLPGMWVWRRRRRAGVGFPIVVVEKPMTGTAV